LSIVKQAILLNLLFCYFVKEVINVRDTIMLPIVKHGILGSSHFLVYEWVELLPLELQVILIHNRHTKPTQN
jgi:hypothetical protein